MDLDRLIPAAFSAMEAFGRGAMSVFLAIPIALALAAAAWFISMSIGLCSGNFQANRPPSSLA